MDGNLAKWLKVDNFYPNGWKLSIQMDKSG
jgi:hypothetical protein